MITGIEQTTSKGAVVNDLIKQTTLNFIRQLVAACASVLDGYGSFFGLDNRLSKALLMLVTFLYPFTGLMGMLGGLFVFMTKRLLSLPADNERIEVVNGILLGLLIGSLYKVETSTIILVAVGAILVVMSAAVLTEILTRQFKLPILGLPYLIGAYCVLPMATLFMLPAANNLELLKSITVNLPFAQYLHLTQYLPPLGAIYFNGTVIGGLITFLAFFLSSRYLALLAIGQTIICTLLIQAIMPWLNGSVLNLVMQLNAVLTACVIGGLYTVPGKRSIMVALFSGTVCCLLTLSLQRLLSVFGLPVLALPFVLTTYAVFLTLSPQQGGPWSIFWLAIPGLAEKTLERMKLSQARGIDPRSVSLKSPCSGSWQIYQGFNGKHTHQGAWRYALDFFQIEDGVSYSQDGSELRHFHCWAKPVLSPAFGTVIDCRDNCPDNMPGMVDTINNFGNFITIALASGKYVVLAHLQQDSLRVKAGDQVTPGQVLALCGNSGRSPQPHLHMQVQEGPHFGSRTVPFHLSDVVVTSKGNSYYSLCVVPQELDSVTAPLHNAALKKALSLNVGNRLEFDFKENGSPDRRLILESQLDVYGQFFLTGSSGAKVAFTASDDLVAFYGRSGPKDPLLDTFILALGLTPLTEGGTRWQDLTPIRLLPLPLAFKVARYLFNPFEQLAQSDYERHWDPDLKRWIQQGKHTLSLLFGLLEWTCRSEAHLSESLGILYLEVCINGKVTTAILAGQSIREDNGIPERSSICLPNP